MAIAHSIYNKNSTLTSDFFDYIDSIPSQQQHNNTIDIMNNIHHLINTQYKNNVQLLVNHIIDQIYSNIQEKKN